MSVTENTWGGKRAGAGRPKGTTKAVKNPRPARWVSAFDDEWELIKQFAKLVKTDRERAEALLKLI